MSKIKSPWTTQDGLKTAGGENENVPDLDSHYEVWRMAPTPTNAQPMLEALSPDIDASLKNFGGKTPEELRTQAHLIALKAAESYDPNKGSGLRTHVRNSLHKLTRLRQERTSAMHIPENVHAEKKHMHDMTTRFKSENDRDPNLQELADLTGFSLRQIARINKYGSSAPSSAFESEKGDSMTKGRTETDMWKDYVYFELDPIDKKVFEWSTGYHGSEKLPKAEIAKRLKISAPAVSKRISKIVGKLEEGAELNA